MTNKTKRLIMRIPFSITVYFLLKKVYNLPLFAKDYLNYKRKDKKKRFALNVRDFQPCLTDRTKNTPFEPHYTYHPAWAARIVKRINPEFHVDISSSLVFSTMVSAFLPVKFYDYRPAFINLPGLISESADLYDLPFANESIASLSCLHVIEHIGLGRYGDKIDPDGDLVSAKELMRVLAPGGSLLFVAPVGRQRIEFNAHRVYSYEQVMKMFEGLKLEEFSLVPDNFKKTGMIYGASAEQANQQEWGCGCFWFKK